MGDIPRNDGFVDEWLNLNHATLCETARTGFLVSD